MSQLVQLMVGRMLALGLALGLAMPAALGQAEDFSVVNTKPFPHGIAPLHGGVERTDAGLVAVQQLAVYVDQQIAVFLIEFLEHDFRLSRDAVGVKLLINLVALPEYPGERVWNRHLLRFIRTPAGGGFNLRIPMLRPDAV